MTSEVFSMYPTSQADMDDLEVRGIEWIKDKLQAARCHVPQLKAVMDLAEEQELTKGDSYALLAYRLLCDMLKITQAEVERAQRAVDGEGEGGLIVNREGSVIV